MSKIANDSSIEMSIFKNQVLSYSLSNKSTYIQPSNWIADYQTIINFINLYILLV